MFLMFYYQLRIDLVGEAEWEMAVSNSRMNKTRESRTQHKEPGQRMCHLVPNVAQLVSITRSVLK